MSNCSDPVQADEMMKDNDHAYAPLCAALADEIRALGKLVECLADVIVGDIRFATDYMDQCQTFDLVVQHADESARLLDRIALGLPVADAIDHVRLTTVQDRLRARAIRK